VSKERDIEILKFKIAETETKIADFIKFSISESKIKTLQVQLMKYEDDLAALEYE